MDGWSYLNMRLWINFNQGVAEYKYDDEFKFEIAVVD